MKNLSTLVTSLIFLSLMGFLTACGGGSGRTIETTTARQVRDKQTLKNFVLDARNYLEKNYNQALEDFRDVNGPWRYREVYLMLFDDTGKAHFHAGIPSFENQRIGLVDLKTGQVIVDQLITEGLKSGGGYAEYHFDDPSTTEKEQSRKITYVTTFRRSENEPTLLIGAGFFPDR